MLEFLKKDNEFKLKGEVSNPGGDIVFITQRTVGGSLIHDIPKGNKWGGPGGEPLMTDEEGDELIWYVSTGAHINVQYDVSGEDITKDGKTIRTACIIGPTELTVMGTRKGRHVNVQWVSSKSAAEVEAVLREELRRSLILYAAATGLVSALCIYFI